MFELAFFNLDLTALAAQVTGGESAAQAFSGVKLLARVFHLLGGITIVGGLLYMRLVLTPALGDATPETESVQAAMRRRWAKWVGVAVAALLFSGFYSLFEVVRTFEVPKYYHPIFGMKFLFALFLFFIASVLAGRSPAAERFRQRSTFWLNVALLVSLAIVVMAVILGLAPKTPKVASVAAQISALVPLA